MIKRTLFFENPTYLSTKNEQLVVDYPDKLQPQRKAPIEDIGMIILESRQISITNALLDKLAKNKTAILSCDQQHMPSGLMLPMYGHSQYSERIALQIGASKPLRKNLWTQTVASKILNQAGLLADRGVENSRLQYLARTLQSGDLGNHEAVAAAYYWQRIFCFDGFSRDPSGAPPNDLLNYGYAILRAVTARALVSSGMLPALGIWHRNKYNAFCLADDIMEPYRPYVDLLVCQLVDNSDDCPELTTDIKSKLLQISNLNVILDGKTSPLMVAMSRTTNSLFECYEGMSRKILFSVYGQ